MPSAPAWYAVAAGAHLIWGCYGPVARRIQQEGVGGLLLMGFANLVNTVVLGGWVLVKGQVRAHEMRSRMLYVFLVLVVGRATTNVMTFRYTAAYFGQLVQLSSPLITALTSSCCSSKAPLPRFFWPLFLATAVGAVMALGLSDSLLGTGPDGATEFSNDDAIGVALSAISTCFLSLGFNAVHAAKRDGVTADTILLLQQISVSSLSTGAGLALGQEPRAFLDVDLTTGIYIGVFAFVILLVGNVVQLRSIQEIGGVRTAMMLPLRLVPSILLSYLIMDEPVESPLQWVGLAVVFLAVSAFVVVSARAQADGGGGGGGSRAYELVETTDESRV